MNDAAPTFFAHPTAILDAGCEIGAGSKIWHFCHVSAGATLGEGCILGQNVFVADGVRLGKNVRAQNNVSIFSGVECEDDVFLGPSMTFTNVLNPRSAVNRKSEFRPTRVRKGATIGANATILCGIEIGAFAMVGAGAVVTRSVAAHSLVVGSPARHRGWVSESGQKLVFDSKNEAVCPETGQRYRLENGQCSRIF